MPFRLVRTLWKEDPADVQTKPERTPSSCTMSTWPYGEWSKVASYSHWIPNKPQLEHKVTRPFNSAFFFLFSSIQHIFFPLLLLKIAKWKYVTEMQGIRRGQEDSHNTKLGLLFPRLTKIHVCLLWRLLSWLRSFLGIWWQNAKWWEPLCACLRWKSQIWWEKTPLNKGHVVLLALISKRSTSLLQQPPPSQKGQLGKSQRGDTLTKMWCTELTKFVQSLTVIKSIASAQGLTQKQVNYNIIGLMIYCIFHWFEIKSVDHYFGG